MGTMTRRALVWFSASLAGLAIIWSSMPSFGLSNVVLAKSDRRFVPDPKSPKISFGEARSSLAKLVQDEIELSQKVTGTQYSPGEVKKIHDRIWDATQLGLIQHYSPKEEP